MNFDQLGKQTDQTHPNTGAFGLVWPGGTGQWRVATKIRNLSLCIGTCWWLVVGDVEWDGGLETW